MKTKIKIYNKLAIFERNSIIYDGNNLELEFTGLNKLLNYYVKTENGNLYLVENSKTIIPVISGVVKIEIFATLNGKEVKRWICEDLIINELNNGIEAIPEIEHLKKLIVELRAEVNTLKADNEMTRALVLELNELDKGE